LSGGFITVLDHRISTQMRHWGIRESRVGYHLIYPLTWFGQRGPVVLVALSAALWMSWRVRRWEPIGRLALALVLLTLAVYAGKYGFGRSAPPVDAVRTAHGQSFPSGHLANSILVWGVMAWLAAKYATEPRPALARLAAVLSWVRVLGPICVIVSMTLLDFHWMSDFIAGAAVGIALLWIVTAPMPVRLRASAAR
jgi:membrane-associated phospholipid phosphatase